MATERIEFEVGDRVVKISNPHRVYFSARGETKLDLARYYLSVADGIVNALYHRPCMLHRFPDGVDGEKVHQKRLPHGAPAWVETVRVHFPRYNRDADELCVTHPADIIWAVQMSTVEFHPWNSRRDDVEKPDEWRIDLDPMPVARYADVRRVSEIVRELLEELGAVGYPKTSGGKGLHIYVRVVPDYGHPDVRRAAWAFAREVERRSEGLVDLTWWRKDRDPASIFVDYNQNARDHTIACAYSVRGTPEGVVSAPLTWDEIADAEPRDFTIATMPARFADLGDLHADIDDRPVPARPAAGMGRARRAGCQGRAGKGGRARVTPVGFCGSSAQHGRVRPDSCSSATRRRQRQDPAGRSPPSCSARRGPRWSARPRRRPAQPWPSGWPATSERTRGMTFCGRIIDCGSSSST